ncbi:VCBS repeat-containing protein [Larkinella rosea]|uniref:RNA-binding protein n=1 Tax=Larkinella rosea TaxID=2025312 RepID=A0A3P1BDJ9_9BACT|nr:VCBS repeat-containing protein [Larkinella rosea]RRA99158.1 RNA-binding protein [Larkinella rosea]
MRRLLVTGFYLLNLLFLFSCRNREEEPPVFERIPAEKSGIQFANMITENDSVNLLDYEYVYNGGGVAVLDVNLDGLPDLFFSGNQVPSRLYLNLGNLQFKDITESAGIRGDNWATGVAVADVNGDGFPDLYVCSARVYGDARRTNRLYINNRKGGFTESAAAYGLAYTGFSTMAAFLDYDRDGDLDLFIATYANETWDTSVIHPKITDGSGKSADKLFQNNGNGTFTDVSKKAGMLIDGYGLGLAICDINNDNWPDIYVSNDYVDDDFIYLNNQNGTFTECAAKYLKHTSNFAMGNDIADINNDGLPDIMAVDMLPEDNERQKLFSGAKNYDKFMMTLAQGYLPSYMRNTLQLNNGNGTFSEIGQLAGVHATDWSWAPLLADFDNDGFKDLFISNGYPKDITNRDFSVYNKYAASPDAPNRLPENLSEQHRIMLRAVEELQGSKLQNYVFRNNGGDRPGDLTFTKKSDAWGLRELSFSNGAAYADLDNDGDLDLVVNNINDPVFLYKNRSNELKTNHYLRLKLVGDSLNTAGLGAKVSLYAGKNDVQYLENSPYRGFQSSVESVLHFGLGKTATADSLLIQWPDGKRTILRNVKANQVITVRHKDAVRGPVLPEKPKPVLFAEVAARLSIDFRHQENEYADFKVEHLLPHKYSQSGPGIAVGDVNGDGREDFFVGNSSGYPGKLFLQTADGRFTGKEFNLDQPLEDLGVLLFDADGDNDLDLFIVSGSNEQMAETSYYQPRLYRNDGQGNFSRDPSALPRITDSGSCVVAADYDRDGDLDLFVGGRVYPGKYPLPARSYILRNDGGKFSNVTDEVGGKALSRVGLVTSALWTDFDNDGQIDLMVAGEWMPVTVFKNDQGRFTNVSESLGLQHTRGWWNSLASGDFDNDGDMDYVLGNCGQNSRYKPTADEPIAVYAKDFDQNGTLDPVLTYYLQGQQQATHARDELIGQMNFMRRRFLKYADYAKSSFADLFMEEELKGAYVLTCDRFESVYLQNEGNGKFTLKPLPVQVQFAPLYGMTSLDVDQDGFLDLLTVGNSYATEVTIGRYDASIGLYLKGDGKGNFQPTPVTESGFTTTGDAKGLATLHTKTGQHLVLVTQNSGPLLAFSQPNQKPQRVLALQRTDAWAEITLANGQKRRQELAYGSTYLSQSARTLVLPVGVVSVTIYSFAGKARRVALTVS